MAYGSCKRCGNAREECECPGSPLGRLERQREQTERVVQKMDTNAAALDAHMHQLRKEKRLRAQ